MYIFAWSAANGELCDEVWFLARKDFKYLNPESAELEALNGLVGWNPSSPNHKAQGTYTLMDPGQITPELLLRNEAVANFTQAQAVTANGMLRIYEKYH